MNFSIINGNSIVILTIRSNGNVHNSLNSFKVNVLIIDCASYSPNVAHWNTTLYFAGPIAANQSIPAVFGKPLSDYHCIYGYSAVNRVYSSASFFTF